MNINSNQMMRHGAYGILIKDDTLLLTQKRSGPYQGLWDLPGGAIEFGESPEEALKREILEETGLIANSLQLLSSASHTGNYSKDGGAYAFHHLGYIYKVHHWQKANQAIPEETCEWFQLNKIDPQILTPFAQHALKNHILLSTWRPSQRIRAKVLALIKRQHPTSKKEQLLVLEVKDDHDQLKGYCPLGGGIDFGEFAEIALRREMLEELECSIQLQGKPLVFENLFEHHGIRGHEIIFAFPIHVDNPEIYTQDSIQITESSGSLHWTRWIDCAAFKTGQALLFPEKLRAHL